MGDGGTAHGLTTVVFMDVEGSTALLDRVGDRSGLASVARQLDVVSELVEDYGGHSVKSTGGEVLVSDVVRLLTGAGMPVRFVDRGRCRGLPLSSERAER